jgi:hypothetical protein
MQRNPGEAARPARNARPFHPAATSATCVAMVVGASRRATTRVDRRERIAGAARSGVRSQDRAIGVIAVPHAVSAPHEASAASDALHVKFFTAPASKPPPG